MAWNIDGAVIGSVDSKMAWRTHFFFIWRLSRFGKELFIYTMQCQYSILLIRVSKRVLLAGKMCVKQPHFKNVHMWPVLSYQYSRTGEFGNDGLHCEPFIIKGCDWTGESQVKTVPIDQKMVISYYQLLWEHINVHISQRKRWHV